MTGQLTRVEVRRLLRNPYLWTVVIGTIALLATVQHDTLPNLGDATITAAMATFFIAAMLMMVANLATLRDQREGVPEALAALPGRADVRTRAVLLATGSLGPVLVAAAIGVHLLIRLTEGPAGGRVDLPEAIGAMLAAAVLAVFGAALARWAPSAITAPAVLGMLAIGFFLGPLFPVAWHLPITAPYEMQVFGRPAWPRLLYLVAALALLGAVALLRHGRRPLRLGVAAAAFAAAATAGVGVAAAAPQSLDGVVDQAEPVAGEPDLTCVQRNAVSYCHFPGFASWIPYWARAAEPVAAALPPRERHRMPTIAQHTSFGPPLMRGDERALVPMAWSRGEAEEGDRAQLAGQIAGLVTGLADPGRTHADIEQSWCDGRGRARTVVTLWLAGQVAPPQPAVSSTEGPQGYQEESYLGSVGYGQREIDYARALLDRAGARQLIWEHWELLLDPDTTIETALPLLGLPDQFPAESPVGPPCD